MDIEAHVNELESLLPQVQHPMTKALLHDAINRNKCGITKTIKPQQASTASISPTIQVKTYGWDQSDKSVKIYISDIPGLEGATESQLISEFTDISVTVKIRELNNRNYNFSISELGYTIKPETSKAILKRGTIIVTMMKADNRNWEELTRVAIKTAEKKKKKDEIPDPAKKGSEADPSASIMNMMQKMYDEGDDEMKRTISKAWYESKSGKSPSVPSMGGMGAMGGMGGMGAPEI